ncbi:bifunctional metallophosphatase/5'-nucleotidase [Dokdonia sinensis]|uniref:Bifunctional metallophosphatase/5'-nucleotidase n=1 Tax=Dokdonia sinensis TaxID=2479847 RepID=A0A3M0G1T3_9FLAO|nr:metallophosphatase [Dokdonia sinensis]RMB56142.1 bifunctional metallophosphatase/5'-nucleotidase [Dokdonia sinensis]
MKRRSFIQKSAAAGSLIGLSGVTMSALSLKAKKHITILHTNDVHSHIEPFDKNDPKFPNQGGVARRMTLIENVRKENPNTLLLDAGDIFQGTPYFNFYGGELEFKLMSMLKYDAATLGNHDFDNGIDGLYAQLPHADFQLLTANYDFSNTLMDGHTKPYNVFVKDGVKIGVFGLGIALDGLVNKRLYKETKYLDPVEIATDITQKLRSSENCDLVICLSHLGYDYKDPDRISDIKLASLTSGIDLIIGGHTHTFLEKPTIVQNKDGQFVLVNQVGWAGVNVGRIDFYLDDANNIESQATVIEV